MTIKGDPNKESTNFGRKGKQIWITKSHFKERLMIWILEDKGAAAPNPKVVVLDSGEEVDLLSFAK